jgi:hypothetical protein
MSLAAFFLPIILPFFVMRRVDGVGVAVDASSDAVKGTAGAAAFFLFFFVLAVAEGTGGHGAL